MSKGSKAKRRYCLHCGHRVPMGAPPCKEQPDLRERTPMASVSWTENGKQVSSLLPVACLKRVPS